MSAETWLDDNNRYLAASLQWLRLKLQRFAADSLAGTAPALRLDIGDAPAQAGALAPARRAGFGHGRGIAAPAPAAVSKPQHGHATAPPAMTAELVAAAAEQRATVARCDPPPALPLLAQRMRLSVFETDTLLLCVAAELDPDIGMLIAAAEGNAAHTHPSFALALQLFDEPSWDALSPHRPLRYARLLDINQPGATPLTAAALRADERIVHFVKGLNGIDERLATLLVGPADEAAPLLSDTQQAVAQDLLHRLRTGVPATRTPTVILLGADGASKLETARAVCGQLGRHLYRLPLVSMPVVRAEAEQLARLWQRECLLLPLALYIEADELDGVASETVAALRALLERELGLVFVALRETTAMPMADALSVEVAKPTPAEQHEAWLAALQPALPPSDAERAAARLASQFNLNLRDVGHAVVHAAGEPASGLAERAWKICRQWSQPRLDQLAQRIDARATWNDLVLSDEALSLLRQIAAQVRHRYRVYQSWGYAKKLNRGLGISALFAGESGTGKTMAAEVIANELELVLYRIDLSAVVSKYIGETEKNLRKLFDAAELGGAILFFDEADALFGKRSEVKDSHDRYANIEINYLLQRMEAYSGLAILATNMKSALDPAFLRRLRFVVDFRYPGAAERNLLWRKALLPAVPHEALDYERLARFNLSGGNVTSVALNAVFTAAQRGEPLTMAMLLSAVRAELRKLDKPVSEAEFR